MADNVIRRDVVQIDFEVDDGLQKFSKQMDDLKKSLNGSLNSGVDNLKDGFDDLKKSVNGAGKADGLNNLKNNVGKVGSEAKKTTDSVGKMKDKLDQMKNVSVEKLKSGLKKVSDTLSTIGKKAAGAAFTGLKKLAGISFKALSVGASAVATGLGAIATQAVKGFADFEQLVGGVETLFGAKGASSVEEYAKLVGKSVDSVQGEFNKLKESENMVLKNANDAYKTAGLSANEYMETASGFAASLLQGLNGDTKKAAEYANTAIVDMADNANKMGTDISSIQLAYQGFAKQNYTMLDNLKLGYGGTKTEMERLVKEASQMTDVQKKLGVTVDGSSMSFANIVNAIHVVQENMGILGTTHNEAEHTVQGSLYSMKAAWQNLLVAIGSGQNLDQTFDNMISSIEIFGDNIMPVLERSLSGIGTVIEKLAPKIAEKLPELAQKLIPPLIKATITMVQSLLKALPSIIKTVATTIVEIFGQQFPIIGKIGEFFKNNANGIANAIKVIIPAVVALGVALKGISAVKSVKSLFGGGKSGGKGGESGGLMDIFTGLAKANTKTILKGVANMTIILGALAGLLWVMTKVFKSGIDFSEMGQVIILVGALGGVGLALAVFADIVGTIPVATVAKGLANMAIILVGVGALLWAMTKVFKDGIDFSEMFQVISLIGILGTVGSVLSVFAGIIGLIPIPIVLAGLANIGLVLGGITRLIVAFGELTKIQGFTEFLEKGGQVLVKIMNILGEMVGALAGGLIEGLSSCLPALGENLGKFGENIKPLFTSMAGVDMEGVGAFFTSLVGLLGIATGNEIVEGIKSFFGGSDESGLSKLGTDLSNFATNSKGFFDTVATLTENGFANATKMFECLGGVKNLPTEGGIKSWIVGDINYESLANGLGQLANENVVKFFNTVAQLPENGFTNAKTLFDTLADMKSLPTTGGVKGWFNGEIDYSKIASGLGSLGGEGVKNFFDMVAGLDQKAFDNATALFTCLSDMGDLTSGDSFWERMKDGLFGDDGGKTKLGTIADELSTFSTKVQGFFEQVNNLNLANLNGLWESLSKPSEISGNALDIVVKNIDEIVKKVTNLPKRMANGLKSTGQTLATAMADIWKNAVKSSVEPVNKLLTGANWILKELGSSKTLASWKPYAKGTDGHTGGNALVNDGRGAELVQMPNGNAFIPKGKNVFLPNAPKGMKVLSAEQTAQMMGKSSPTFRYAEGTGNIDVWDYYDNATGLISKIKDKYVNYDGLTKFRLDTGKALVTTISGEMVAWVKKMFEESGGKGLGSYIASAGVEQWRSTVIQALKMEGLYSEANVRRTLYQMQTESGGNPRAINLWDSNAKKGIPSKGLMQCIDPTFKAYARPGFDKNIYDPLSNILASIRYARARYGSLERAYRGVGYANGGIATRPSIFGEKGAEMAIPLKPSKRKRALELWSETGDRLGVSSYSPESDATRATQTNNVENNSYAPVFNLTISGSNDDRLLSRKVKRWIDEALEEQVERMARRTKRLQEA